VKVIVITAQKKLFEGDASEVILPGSDGEFSVLEHHQACMYSLRSGQVRIKFSNASRQDDKAITIRAGLAKILNNMLTVMAETF